MAMKVQLIFLLAIVLHVSTKVTSLEEEIVTERHHHHHHHHHKKVQDYAPVKPPVYAPYKAPIRPPTKAPVYPPKNAPVQPPVKPPVYPPKNAPSHSPVKAPVYPPKRAPTHPPIAPPPAKSTIPQGNCLSMCATYCKPHHSKRQCLRTCVPCCGKYKCVPRISKRCRSWDVVVYHGQKTKCPKYLF